MNLPSLPVEMFGATQCDAAHERPRWHGGETSDREKVTFDGREWQRAGAVQANLVARRTGARQERHYDRPREPAHHTNVGVEERRVSGFLEPAPDAWYRALWVSPRLRDEASGGPDFQDQ